MDSRSFALLFLVACAPSAMTDEIGPSGGGGGKTDDTEGGIARNWRVGGSAGNWTGWGRDRKTVVSIRGGEELVWNAETGHLLERRTVGDARCDATSPTGYSVICRPDGIEIKDTASPNGVHVALHAVDAAYFGGDRIAAILQEPGTSSSTLSIVDRVTRTRLQTIDMQGRIDHVEFLPDDRVLVLSFGGPSRIYRVSDGVLVATLKAASASPDRTVIASLDGVYDINTLQRLSRVSLPNEAALSAVAWAADSQSFAVVPLTPAMTDRDNAYVHTRAGLFMRYEYRPSGIQLEGTAPDGSTLTTGSGAVWLSPHRALSIYGADPRITAGEDVVVAAEPTGMIDVYDGDGTVRGSYRVLGSPWEQRVALDPTGTLIAVTERDSLVSLFDVANGALANERSVHDSGGGDVVWSPDGTKFALASSHRIRIFDRAGSFQREFATSSVPVSVAWRRDGQAIAGSLMDNHLVGFDVRNGGQLFDVTTDRALTSLSFSADGAWVAGPTQYYSEVRVVRIDGSETVTLAHSIAATWSPTANELAVSSDRGDLAIWDLATRMNVGARSVSSVPCKQIRWHDDDAIIVSCSDNTVASFRADP